MTKKSSARLARDAQAKEAQQATKKVKDHLQNNTAWDDLKKTSTSIYELLNYDSQILGLFFSQEPLMAMVPANQRERVINSLSTLRNDVVTLLDIHQSIAAKHQAFSGRAATEEEGLKTHECYMAYMDVAARFEQLDKPIIDYLNGVRIDVIARVTELEHELAEKAKSKEAAEAAEQTAPTTGE